MLGLEVLAQRDVSQVAVVGKPGVGGVVDLDQIGHQAKCAGWATRTTSPTTMIAGARTA